MVPLLAVLLAAAPVVWAKPPLPLRVCVYFDAGKDSADQAGRLHAIMLENLLGHFREATPSLLPAGEYRRGDLGRCDRAAYLGTRFGASLPPDFLDDVAAARGPFLWLNYNVRQLQDRMGAEPFAAKTGFRYDFVTGFATGTAGGFYRYFDYKGRRFAKLAVKKSDGSWLAAPDIGVLHAASAVVLSTASRSDDPGKTTPYVTVKNGFFFVADDPFLFIHEQDRYLILADVLFDFLKLAPRSARRPALLRLEDVHPEYDLDLLYLTIDLLKERRVPFAISLIPKFVAPGAPESSGVELWQRPKFLAALRYARQNGGEILLHGYTHQADGLDGCRSTGSGDDYEFWDRCRQVPHPADSNEWVHERLRKAKALLARSGVAAVGWVTPHYAASPRDFAVFGAEFERTVQRVTYSLGWGSGETPVSVTQFFPYTVYADHYGQFVWPENLGFVPMPGTGAAPEDIVESARLGSVVRDGWASFYWHPQLMDRDGEAERLGRIIDGIRVQGYTFVSLESLRRQEGTVPRRYVTSAR